MKAHWDSLCACDFFSVEALGINGTVRYMVFFVMAVKTRAVEIAGIRVDPDGERMKQMARNLTDSVDGFLRNASYLINDRDPVRMLEPLRRTASPLRYLTIHGPLPSGTLPSRARWAVDPEVG
jgi:hypothetical protein